MASTESNPFARDPAFRLAAVRVLVRNILESPCSQPWSTQGLGMLRTYLDPDKVWRLNLWHHSCAVPGVSTIHDHPWDFKSLVVGGRFTNVRYFEAAAGASDRYRSRRYLTHRLRCGEDGGPVGPQRVVHLVPHPDEMYGPGEVYSQKAEEIHESRYLDGTVTLNERVRRPDGDHANIYWPDGGPWVDAEPHMASREQIELCCVDARRWLR